MSQTSRSKYRQRLDGMFKTIPESMHENDVATSYLQSVWAKYLCVLSSGYLEQSMREIVTEYCNARSADLNVSRYVDKTWPESRNMKWGNIKTILENLNGDWGIEIEEWFQEQQNRKSDVNDIIAWRNDIAHGKDANTTGVTVTSVRDKYKTLKETIDKIETIVGV